MTEDPYLTPQTPETMDRTGFCAVKLVPGTFDYYLKTFNSFEMGYSRVGTSFEPFLNMGIAASFEGF